jgi:hypothetical protein
MGCGNWSLKLKNRVLRRIFEAKRSEVTGGWTKGIMKSLIISALH